MNRLNPRIVAVYRDSAIVVLNILLIFIAIELIATIFLTLAKTPTIKATVARITGRPNDLIKHYTSLPYYAQQEWTSQYWQEHNSALKKMYHPYSIWRSPPFAGEMLKIDQNGIRYTPGAKCVPDAKKVFLFGGSTMWGWGAPDWGTISAYLQKFWQSVSDAPVCVVNFGENAYISTQDLIQLMLLLEAGNVPDIAIFYDGVNEVLVASQSGQPMLHHSYRDISARFQDPLHPLLRWLRELNAVWLLQLVISEIVTPVHSTQAHSSIDTEQLADAVIRVYLNNYKIVSALAKAYQFDCYFFWQPYILLGNKPLTNEEHSMVTGLDWILKMDATLIRLFKTTYGRIEEEASGYENLHYLAHIFDQEDAQIWIDTWGHMTPVGNELIAQAIFDEIKAK